MTKHMPPKLNWQMVGVCAVIIIVALFVATSGVGK